MYWFYRYELLDSETPQTTGIRRRLLSESFTPRPRETLSIRSQQTRYV
jgi:hypothetical protein